MTREHKRYLLSSAFSILAVGCTGGEGPKDPPGGEPSSVAAELAATLSGQVLMGTTQVPHGFKLFSISQADPLDAVNAETCALVEQSMNLACEPIQTLGLFETCWGQATYFMAHSTPRCAARLSLADYDDPIPVIYAFDLSGVPTQEPPASCGDGVVDEGEQCDDGNTEIWDGCDSTCMIEEFQGCEAVIEQYYQQAGLAVVSKDFWASPRSHLMVHDQALALQPVTSDTCNAALSLGTDVCNELVQTMPFVGSCWLQGAIRSEADHAACDLRFEVSFQKLDPDSGVFTTSLPGILAFTIR